MHYASSTIATEGGGETLEAVFQQLQVARRGGGHLQAGALPTRPQEEDAHHSGQCQLWLSALPPRDDREDI